MLRSFKWPAVAYSIVELKTVSQDGIITIGRDSESSIHLDTADVPYLLSRKHAIICSTTETGELWLRDLGSTNGTFAARQGRALRRLQQGLHWVLSDGDLIAFGGPEVIVSKPRETDTISHVDNPFLFRFQSGQQEHLPSSPLMLQRQVAEPSAEALPCAAPGPQANQESQENCGYELQHGCMLPGHAAPVEPLAEEVLHEGGKENSTSQPPNPVPHSVQQVLANHLSCPVCQDWLVGTHTLSCGHMFCGLCLATWLAKKQTCPSCRKIIKGAPVRCFQIDNTIGDLLDHNLLSPSSKHERKRKLSHWHDVEVTVHEDWALRLQPHSRPGAAAIGTNSSTRVQPAGPADSARYASAHVGPRMRHSEQDLYALAVQNGGRAPLLNLGNRRQIGRQ